MDKPSRRTADVLRDIDRTLLDSSIADINRRVDLLMDSACRPFFHDLNDTCELCEFMNRTYDSWDPISLVVYMDDAEGICGSGLNGRVFPDLYGEWAYLPLDEAIREANWRYASAIEMLELCESAQHENYQERLLFNHFAMQDIAARERNYERQRHHDA